MNSANNIKRPYYAVLFLQWLATALPLALLVLILQARGINLFQVGLLLGAYSLAIVFLELPTGGLADAIGRKRVTLLAYGATVISSIIILVAFSFPMFLLAFVLNGVGLGDEVVGSGSHRPHRRVEGAERRQHEDRHARPDP
jgi:MFS family permease